MDDDPTEAPDDPADATKREGHGSERRAVEPARDDDRLARGTAVGRYIVIDVLGAGGMGVVYAAYDPELDRKVAVKLLTARTLGGSTGGQAWLLREAQALARLAHPNVIAVHDVGTLPGDRVFVAMELVEGTTLREWLKARNRTWREVVPVMRAAAAGLAAAHAAGLVHRDFKPDNVLVGNDGRIRVMDFGLARLRTDDDGEPAARTSDLSIEARSPLSESLTEAGTVVGTPAYMAPEIYEAKPADARSDQYSFGVALYEALYRTRPFDRKAPSTKPKPPPDIGVPVQIQRVVMRAIAIAPEQRFASMDDVIAELSVDPGAARRRVAIAAAGVVAVVAVIGGVVALGHSRGELCKGIDRRLAGAWDSATKQAVRAAFAATKQPFAIPAYGGLERALDGYTSEWTAAATGSCEATRIRGEQTEEVMSLREDCFGQRLEELRALTGLLATADDALVEKGDKVVWGLEPVKKCANVAALRAPNQPPPEARDKIAALRKKLAEAKADLLAGRYLAALVASKAALDGATELKFDPIAAEASIVRAAALLSTGNTDDALAASAEAAWAGLRGKRDDIAASAALGAAMITSDTLGRPTEARVWLGLGNAIAARVGVGDRALDRQRLETEGMVDAGLGDLVAAVAAHAKALVAAVAMYGADGPAVWTTEEMYATTLSKAGAYATAAPHFEHALALREASVGPDHPDVALLLSNLGTVYGHLGRPGPARVAFERALAIRERTYGRDSPMLLATLNNMADALLHSDSAAALTLIERAKRIAERVPGKSHPEYHTIATTYAEVLVAAGRLDEARAAFDELLVLEAKTNSLALAATLMPRAELALREAKWAEAAAFDERAIARLEAEGGKDGLMLWRPLTGLGRAKLELGRPAEARPILERALAIGERAQIEAAELAPTRAALARLQ